MTDAERFWTPILVEERGGVLSDPEDEEFRLAAGEVAATRLREYVSVLVILRETGNAVLWIPVPEGFTRALPADDVENLVVVDDAEALPLELDGWV